MFNTLKRTNLTLGNGFIKLNNITKRARQLNILTNTIDVLIPIFFIKNLMKGLASTPPRLTQ